MDSTPTDRPFAEVADRLALWTRVQEAASPGSFARAWSLAGFRLFYVDGLPYPSATMPNPQMVAAGLTPIAFLPGWAGGATLAYRDGILKAFARQWEEQAATISSSGSGPARRACRSMRC